MKNMSRIVSVHGRVPQFQSPKRLVDEMTTTSWEFVLASSTSSCSFSMSKVMLPFPIISWWQCFRLRVTFKSPWVEALCTVLIRLPRCVADAKWRLHLRMTDGDDCHTFFERDVLSEKPERGPWSHVRRPMRDGIDRFCAFHGSNYRIYTVGQAGHAVYAAAVSETGVTQGSVAANICV